MKVLIFSIYKKNIAEQNESVRLVTIATSKSAVENYIMKIYFPQAQKTLLVNCKSNQ